MEGLVANKLATLFSQFLTGFTKDDFKLNLFGGSDNTVELRNLEVKRSFLLQTIGPLVPNLLIQRAYVSCVRTRIPWTRIKTEPIVVSVDQVIIVLEEPAQLNEKCDKAIYAAADDADKEIEKKEREKESQNEMEEVKKKSGGKKYTLFEKIIDGVRLEVGSVQVELRTRGAYKTMQHGPWTPPVLRVDISDLHVYTTNERWQVVNLHDARLFNKKRDDVHVFKQIDLNLSLSLHPYGPGGAQTPSIPILNKYAIRARGIGRKRRLDDILGFQIDANLAPILISLSTSNLALLLHSLSGLGLWTGRADLPAPIVPPVPDKMPADNIPHPGLLVNLALDSVKIQLKDADPLSELVAAGSRLSMNPSPASGSSHPSASSSRTPGLEITLNRIYATLSSLADRPSWLLQMQASVGELLVQELDTRFTLIRSNTRNIDPSLLSFVLDQFHFPTTMHPLDLQFSPVQPSSLPSGSSPSGSRSSSSASTPPASRSSSLASPSPSLASASSSSSPPASSGSSSLDPSHQSLSVNLSPAVVAPSFLLLHMKLATTLLPHSHPYLDLSTVVAPLEVIADLNRWEKAISLLLPSLMSSLAVTMTQPASADGSPLRAMGVTAPSIEVDRFKLRVEVLPMSVTITPPVSGACSSLEMQVGRISLFGSSQKHDGLRPPVSTEFPHCPLDMTSSWKAQAAGDDKVLKKSLYMRVEIPTIKVNIIERETSKRITLLDLNLKAGIAAHQSRDGQAISPSAEVALVVPEVAVSLSKSSYLQLLKMASSHLDVISPKIAKLISILPAASAPASSVPSPAAAAAATPAARSNVVIYSRLHSLRVSLIDDSKSVISSSSAAATASSSAIAGIHVFALHLQDLEAVYETHVDRDIAKVSLSTITITANDPSNPFPTLSRTMIHPCNVLSTIPGPEPFINLRLIVLLDKSSRPLFSAGELYQPGLRGSISGLRICANASMISHSLRFLLPPAHDLLLPSISNASYIISQAAKPAASSSSLSMLTMDNEDSSSAPVTSVFSPLEVDFGARIAISGIDVCLVNDDVFKREAPSAPATVDALSAVTLSSAVLNRKTSRDSGAQAASKFLFDYDEIVFQANIQLLDLKEKKSAVAMPNKPLQIVAKLERERDPSSGNWSYLSKVSMGGLDTQLNREQFALADIIISRNVAAVKSILALVNAMSFPPPNRSLVAITYSASASSPSRSSNVMYPPSPSRSSSMYHPNSGLSLPSALLPPPSASQLSGSISPASSSASNGDASLPLNSVDKASLKELLASLVVVQSEVNASLEDIASKAKTAASAGDFTEEQVSSLIPRICHPEAGFACKDRKHRLKTFENCFLGSEAVNWLLQATGVTNRQACVSLGRRIQARGVFSCATGMQFFEDDMSIYRFDQSFASSARAQALEQAGSAPVPSVNARLQSMQSSLAAALSKLAALNQSS